MYIFKFSNSTSKIKTSLSAIHVTCLTRLRSYLTCKKRNDVYSELEKLNISENNEARKIRFLPILLNFTYFIYKIFQINRNCFLIIWYKFWNSKYRLAKLFEVILKYFIRKIKLLPCRINRNPHSSLSKIFSSR